MRDDQKFDSFFEALMVPEKVEDNGFSTQVLSHVKSRSSISFFRENLWEGLSLISILIFFRVDLFMMKSYFKILDLLEVFTFIETADVSFSIHKSTVIIIFAVVAYFSVEKFQKVMNDI